MSKFACRGVVIVLWFLLCCPGPARAGPPISWSPDLPGVALHLNASPVSRGGVSTTTELAVRKTSETVLNQTLEFPQLRTRVSWGPAVELSPLDSLGLFVRGQFSLFAVRGIGAGDSQAHIRQDELELGIKYSPLPRRPVQLSIGIGIGCANLDTSHTAGLDAVTVRPFISARITMARVVLAAYGEARWTDSTTEAYLSGHGETLTQALALDWGAMLALHLGYRTALVLGAGGRHHVITSLKQSAAESRWAAEVKNLVDARAALRFGGFRGRWGFSLGGLVPITAFSKRFHVALLADLFVSLD